MATVKKTEKAVKKVKAEAKIKLAPKKAEVKKVVKKEVVKELPKETGLKLSVYDVSGKVVESFDLPKEVFGAAINKNLMTQAVRVFLFNQRRGTVKTKSRGEVNISTRKIYKQKGTGRARHGAASAPIFVGGGIAFGPRQRDYSLKLNQKQKQAALFSALSSRLKDGDIKLVKGLEKIEPKTKNVVAMLKALDLTQKKSTVLLITPKTGKEFNHVSKAARNITGVEIRGSNVLNTYEILKAKNIVFMKDALNYFTGGAN
jgi:large subunit ribosomal protein L4